MKLDAADLDDLRPLIEAIVAATMDRLESERAQVNGRLGYTEQEAADLLGVRKHVLRDARLRGEIVAAKCGNRWLYSRKVLLEYLRGGAD